MLRPFLLVLLVAVPAWAHVSGVIAKAEFDHPTRILMEPVDGGFRWSFVPDEADQKYTVSWVDNDVDPTAQFTFYYLDHMPTDAISASQIETIATPVITTSGAAAADIFASCTCDGDAGVTCEDLDGGTRSCPNSFEWDTSAVADGVYWIVAVNNDPPYHIYNPSQTPVRVAHGSARHPIVVLLRPDGLGSANLSYVIQGLALGTGPLTVDLSYGPSNLQDVLGPTKNIAKDVPVVVGADNTWSYTWDTTGIPSDVVFVRASIKDGNGVRSYTDSRYALSVFHPVPLDGGVGDASVPRDLAAPSDFAMVTTPPTRTCNCAVGGAGGGAAAPSLLLPLLALGGLAAAAALRINRRRRDPRRGCRSGCSC